MIKYHIFLIAIASLVTSTIRAAAADQPGPAVEQVQVADVIRSFFAAAKDDDLDKFRAVTTPDFYAFDAGGRFNRETLMDLIKGAHAAGNVYVWSVNDPEVHIAGDTAWITYVNRGSVKDASGTKDVTWLESAVLEKEKGIWRIHFLHSTRVPEKK